jgi:4-amino-4-deoxy-L-arabinose transferase-like glycosyltransferase
MTKNTLLILGTIVLLGGIHLATLREGHEWGDDFSLYVAHARNLVEGRAYTDTGYVYNPHNSIVSPRSYPPLFPLLLAPVYSTFGMDLTAMKAFVIVLFMLLLGVLAVVAGERLPLPYVLGFLVLFALNPYVWQHKDRLLSETPFMLFAFLALFLADKALERQGPRSRCLAWGLLAGLVAYLACATRTVGVVLVPSILVVQFLRWRRLGLASLAITAACAVGVVTQSLLLGHNGNASYLDQLVFDPLRFARIAVSLVKGIGGFFENGYSQVAGVFLYGGLALLAVSGYVARLRDRPTVHEAFAVLYLLLLVIWPAAESDPRFLLPILPFFLLFVAEGVQRLRATPLGRLQTSFALGLAAAVLVSYAGWYSRLDLGPVRDGVTTPESVALFDWIRTRTEGEDVFLFQKPRALALYTGRRTLAHHRTSSDDSLWQLLNSSGVTHVVVCLSSPAATFQNSRRILEPFVARHAESIEQVFGNEGFRVYRLRDTSVAARRTE